MITISVYNALSSRSILTCAMRPRGCSRRERDEKEWEFVGFLPGRIVRLSWRDCAAKLRTSCPARDTHGDPAQQRPSGVPRHPADQYRSFNEFTSIASAVAMGPTACGAVAQGQLALPAPASFARVWCRHSSPFQRASTGKSMQKMHARKLRTHRGLIALAGGSEPGPSDPLESGRTFVYSVDGSRDAEEGLRWLVRHVVKRGAPGVLGLCKLY